MNTLKILVLEDHPVQQLLALEQLQRLGVVEPLAAADGVGALTLLRERGAADVVLCDLQMPGMDGLEFLRRASEERLVRGVILYSLIDADLRRAVLQMISLHGLIVLGDVGKPAELSALQAMLYFYQQHHQQPASAPPRHFAPVKREDLLQGVEQGQFVSYYQPKFDLQQAICCGAEVLMRWVHPQRGILAPAAFLDELEAEGLLDQVFLQQLDQSMALQRQLLNQGEELELAFNLLPRQLACSDMVGHIRRTIERHRVPPRLLTFEITEVGLVQAPAISLENLVRLRMMECNLAIDDFGAGYSSLQRLCELPFNQIKLDAHFVRELVRQPRCRAVVGASLALANKLDMRLVVEGVETQLERRLLLEMGCVLGQGYWYARPMPEAELLAWPRSVPSVPPTQSL
ncbi:EAL domain-containing protein [Pseudomonas sp. LD120]|uniref:EAL domain-containing response regulator n=1 Tax=Pseudomonas sp. LD120 TaxID=485751 RepID=UPI00135BFFB7|nr:EAL domain-containing response regulator [Pseudomonas sp. LD120]KAF0864582.1 EAL domain-containing protein [Pseudomonas sp. LD120]